MTAVITRFDMSAECCGAAYLDALHYLVLLSIDHVLIPVLFAISSEDIGHLRRSVYCSFILSLLLLVHQIERTFELDVAGRNQMQIDRGCFYGVVAEQLADGIEVVAFIEQVGGEAVTKRVEAALFG